MDLKNAMNGYSHGNTILQAESASSTLTLERINNKWVCVKRLKAAIASDEFANSIYKNESEKCMCLSHGNILRYLEPVESDKAFIMEKGATSISNLVNDKPAILSTTNTIKRMQEELLDAVEYLHSNGIFQIDLTPDTVLLNKDSYELKLFAPLSTCNIKRGSIELNKEFVAPEIINDKNAEPTVEADIYSVGRMIEYFYSFCKMPRGMKRIIRKATSDDPTERYHSIDELRSALRARNRVSQMLYALYIALGVLAIAAFVYLDSTSESGTEEFVTPAANSTHTFDSIESNPDALSGVEQISGDSAIADSIAARAAGNPRQREAETMFRKEFSRQAVSIINKVYSRSSMLGNETEFRTASTTSMAKLQQIAERLADTYNIPAASAQQIASEAINKLTTDRINALQTAK
ncbi:MAG: protein kinase [Bacteroidaceae bacterium]|nr:protein kinase [Bacteroidaceae bacterium]